MSMPINGIASLQQAQNALELVMSAQREAGIVQDRKETDTEQTKRAEQQSVIKQEEAKGKQIRDDDPRQRNRREQQQGEENKQHPDGRPRIDIVI
jgi:hypothetical protein